MACSSSGYCQFEFPKGPPLTDNPVADLKAKYLFLPYGTLLEEGELIRIWMENGQTREVTIEQKISLELNEQGFFNRHSLGLPWGLVALDSGWEEAELLDFYHHPLFNPQATPVVLIFSQVLTPSLNWQQKLHNLLYKIRNL